MVHLSDFEVSMAYEFFYVAFCQRKTTYLSNGVFVIDHNIHRLIVGDLTIALCLESWILSFV